jgi:hypothetical protein
MHACRKHTILSRNAPFCPRRSVNIRFVIRALAQSTWRVHFELTAMGVNNETQAHVMFPHATTDNSTAGWLQLNLEFWSDAHCNLAPPFTGGQVEATQ